MANGLVALWPMALWPYEHAQKTTSLQPALDTCTRTCTCTCQCKRQICAKERSRWTCTPQWRPRAARARAMWTLHPHPLTAFWKTEGKPDQVGDFIRASAVLRHHERKTSIITRHVAIVLSIILYLYRMLSEVNEMRFSRAAALPRKPRRRKSQFASDERRLHFPKPIWPKKKAAKKKRPSSPVKRPEEEE